MLGLLGGCDSLGPAPCLSDQHCPSSQRCDRSQELCVKRGGPGDCSPGERRDCYNGSSYPTRGPCKAGSQWCSDQGQWGPCQGAQRPQAELCSDGIDNDCDGKIDNGTHCSTCQNGATRSCYTGPPASRDQGVCRSGTQTCAGNSWGPCVGEQRPQSETCDGVDNDCNGQVDDASCPPGCTPGQSRSCYSGPQGTLNRGLCQAGVQRCRPGSQPGQVGTWGPCIGEVLPRTESCNRQDDDCNGQIDDQCSNDLCDAVTASRCEVKGQILPTGLQRVVFSFTLTQGTPDASYSSTPKVNLNQSGWMIERTSWSPSNPRVLQVQIGFSSDLDAVARLSVEGVLRIRGQGSSRPPETKNCPFRWSFPITSCNGVEICGDKLDNDCDGTTDESDCQGPPCAPGTTACQVSNQGICVDLKTDAAHCGRCNNTCPTGSKCINGTCDNGCVTGQTSCQGQCVDLQTDAHHCGSCGKACPVGYLCKGASCVLDCPSSTPTKCSVGSGGEKCVDLKSNAGHCGTCGTACSTGQICSSGRCVASCASGQSYCAGSCRNFQSDNQNCGACGNGCATGFACHQGACLQATCNPKTCTQGCCNGLCCGQGSACVQNQCCPASQVCGSQCCPKGYLCRTGGCSPP